MTLPNEKIKLVIDCRMINASGIGTYLKNIIPGVIQDKNFLVTVMGFQKELTLFEWFQQVTFIPLQSKILSLQEQFELPLKIPRCDIYWSPNINGAIWFTRAKNRVTTIHDVFHLAHPQMFSKLALSFIKLLIKSAIYYSKYIITVSDFSKSEIIKYTKCPAGKIVVSHLSVDKSFDSNVQAAPVSAPYFLFVGNVKPHKNLETALRAFQQVDDSSYRFIIVGKKEGFITGYSNTDALIKNLSGRVTFTGFIEDKELKSYYSNAKALIFPSFYEGFGLPVLEAMKFFIPVIASNSSAIPEVGGSAIEYFNPESADELLEKMTGVIENVIKADKQKYEEQLNSFSWSKTIFDHIELFKKTCNKRWT